VGSVIAGASSPAQIQQNAAAAERELTDEEMEELGQMLGEVEPSLHVQAPSQPPRTD